MEFELRVAADSAAIPGVLDRLEAFAEAAELSPRVSHRLALVCEELATNVATHGRAGYPPATFTDLRVALTETELRIRVEDDGPPSTCCRWMCQTRNRRWTPGRTAAWAST